MEGNCHDPVCGVESLLNTISMMNVDVNVQDPLVVLQQLQNSQDDIVHIAEARRLRLLGVVQPSSPVDGDVGRLLVELC